MAFNTNVSFDPISAVFSLFTANKQAQAQKYAADASFNAAQYAADMSYKGAHEANQKNLEAVQYANNLNYRSAQQTNLMNYAINQENNAANLNLAREQNLWNEQQIAKQNAYNSIGHQVEMYRAAGLNPAALAGGNTWTPGGVATSADLANQQAAQMQQPSPMQAPHFQNEYADSARIMLEGQLKGIELKKDIMKNSLATAKLGMDLVRSNVELGLIPQKTKSEIDKNNAEIANIVVNTKRTESMTPWEINNLIQNYYCGLATEHLTNEQSTLTRRQAKAQDNTNKLFSKIEGALAQIPYANLKKINEDIAFIVLQQEQLDMSNDFTRKNGSDYSSFASMYGARLSNEASHYSSDTAWKGMQLQNKQFNARLKYDMRSFNVEMRVRKYIAKQNNLTTLQQAGIMAGASIVNGIMSNTTRMLDNAKNRAFQKMQRESFSRGMEMVEQNPGDAYNQFFYSYGYPPTGRFPVK